MVTTEVELVYVLTLAEYSTVELDISSVVQVIVVVATEGVAKILLITGAVVSGVVPVVKVLSVVVAALPAKSADLIM